MNKTIKEFILYVVVGGISTLTEWAVFGLLDKFATGLYYLASVIIAYVISTFVNWLAGRILVFKTRKQSFWREIISVYLASVIGLLLNLGIMWLEVSKFGIDKMISKVIATVLVFAYNFLIRKYFIYKKPDAAKNDEEIGQTDSEKD